MNQKMSFYITGSEQETLNIGFQIGEKAQIGDIILLFGGLGAGKTVLAKGIAHGLKISSHVTSPTFTLMQVYHGRLVMYHFDLYRLDNQDELYDLGYEEYFYSDDGIAIVEWAERLGELSPENHLRIQIERLDDSFRKITIKAIGKCDRKLEELL